MDGRADDHNRHGPSRQTIANEDAKAYTEDERTDTRRKLRRSKPRWAGGRLVLRHDKLP
jgi:hypothetical protein